MLENISNRIGCAAKTICSVRNLVQKTWKRTQAIPEFVLQQTHTCAAADGAHLQIPKHSMPAHLLLSLGRAWWTEGNVVCWDCELSKNDVLKNRVLRSCELDSSQSHYISQSAIFCISLDGGVAKYLR